MYALPAFTLRDERPKSVQLNREHALNGMVVSGDAVATDDLLQSCNISETGLDGMPSHEFASYVMVASVLLNLDETITKP